jgi:hypothetical protein
MVYGILVRQLPFRPPSHVINMRMIAFATYAFCSLSILGAKEKFITQALPTDSPRSFPH